MVRLFKLDWTMVVSVLLLLVIGLMVLFTISTNPENQEGAWQISNFYRQLIAVFLGLSAMFFLAFYDYRIFNSLSTKLYFSMLLLLALVAFFGTTVRGTTGWIDFGFFNFQPVEVAKIVMIVFLASFLSKKRTELSIPVRIISSIVLVAIPVFLILRQPDLGSSLIIIGTWIAMLLFSGIGNRNIFILAVSGIILLAVSWFFLESYQVERLTNFINPYNDPKGSGYNVIQSMVAVGSGGMWGKGLGHGSQSQLNFLPEKHTDFIFAVISEELGFFGAFLVIALFLIIFFRIRETAKLSRDNFGYLICVGFLTTLFLQTFVNIGMNVGMAPVTGLPLPLLSYGGSSVIMTLSGFGIILNINRRKMKVLD